MEIELHFDGLDDDVVDAVALVQFEDLATAGEPPGRLGATEVGPFAVSSADPSVRLHVDLPDAPTTFEPGLVVRVRARTADGTAQEFFNTTATHLSTGGTSRTRVPLQRIR